VFYQLFFEKIPLEYGISDSRSKNLANEMVCYAKTATNKIRSY
jgi:hypothetical protein